MLDGTLFFVKSARYKSRTKSLSGFFMYYSCNMKLNRILNDNFNLIESAEKKVVAEEIPFIIHYMKIVEIFIIHFKKRWVYT